MAAAPRRASSPQELKMKGAILALALGIGCLAIPMTISAAENTPGANQATNAVDLDRCPYYPSPVLCGEPSKTVAAKAQRLAASEGNSRQSPLDDGPM
jgi:hypothetical protein